MKAKKTKKTMCAECRFCDTQIDQEGKSRRTCTHGGKTLPSNVTSRLACGKFKPPKNSGHWGA